LFSPSSEGFCTRSYAFRPTNTSRNCPRIQREWDRLRARATWCWSVLNYAPRFINSLIIAFDHRAVGAVYVTAAYAFALACARTTCCFSSVDADAADAVAIPIT
jgi:hypothetical protein